MHYLNEYDELYHHGIKGQKWGIRRFQNEDGSLTAAGIERYRRAGLIQKDLNRLDREIAYNKGDAMKIASKARRLEKIVKRYNKRHPNDEKDKLDKYSKQMEDYTEQLSTIKTQNDINKKCRKDCSGLRLDVV